MKLPLAISERLFSRILLVILILGTISLFLSPLFRLSFPESGFNFLGKDKRVELEPGKSVTQVFEAKQNGLSQIDIVIDHLDTLGLRDSVNFVLAQKNCEDSIATGSISAFTASPYIYHHFRFDRILDSAGHSYCLKITYTATKRKKDRPYLSANDGTSFTNTGYFDDGKNRFYEGRSLEIRPSYSNNSSLNNLHELENRLSQYKPAFMKGSVLALGLAVALGSIALVWILIRTKDA